MRKAVALDIKGQKRPNIITIIADDMGAWACGKAAGNEEIVTPNLDALAKEGLFFENFYCVSPVCSPARASIYSGQIPSSHGVLDWIAAGDLEKSALGDLQDVPEYARQDLALAYMDGITMYTDLLHDEGYRCSLSGKWHLGDSMRPQAGYDDWFCMGRGGCEYIKPDIVDAGKLEFKSGYVTDFITERALKYLDGFSDGKPHFVNVAYTAPHSPWEKKQHPQRLRQLYDNCPFMSAPKDEPNAWQVASCPVPATDEERREFLTGYYSAITAMDEGVGKIVQKLKDMGCFEDTLIIFTSDNGMNMGHHGIWGKGNGTFPFNMYDSAIKVPAILCWPKMFGEGRSIVQHRSHYDILPTLVDYLDLPTDRLDLDKLPGRSLRPLIEGCEEDSESDAIVYDEYGQTRMIRSGAYKLVLRYPAGPNELFNMENDPREMVNLIDTTEHSEIQQELQQRLVSWFERYVDASKDALKEEVGGSGQLKMVGDGDGRTPKFRPAKKPYYQR